MDKPGLSRSQRFLTRFAGAETAAAMEAHSRAWMVQCPHCAFERSVWDLGGIRYKATGNPRMLGRCPSCGKSGWHKIRKSEDFPTISAPFWPLVRLIFSVVLASLILTAVVVGLLLKLTGAI